MASALCTLLFLSHLFSHVASSSIKESDFDGRIITRDVCIIGGGSSGTYSAVRLNQQGKSVAVIEKQALLGGHTKTYVDPATRAPINIAVRVWEDTPTVKSYMSYLGVGLKTVNFSAQTGVVNSFADFGSGSPIPASSLPAANPGPGLVSYMNQLSKYPFLDNGFDLPSPVPSDLLEPFGNFLKKYGLDSIAYTVYQTGQGLGNFLAQPAIYVLKNFNANVVKGYLGVFVAAASNDNHELYDKALAKLGSDVHLKSTVRHITRTGDMIQVAVTTPEGDVLIKAKKLLISIPPKLEQLSFLDLEGEEKDLFKQFNNTFYWAGIVRNSGIPDNVQLQPLALTAPFGIPTMPILYVIQPSGIPGLHQVYFGSSNEMSDEQVKSSILSTIAKVVAGAKYPPAPGPVEFVAFENHKPFTLAVSADAIKNGFYRKLNALQGKRNTWWTGAAWQTHDSSQIWDYTEKNVLPHLLK
ncbi:flavin-containing superfamily amine oxidase [Venturia nashicola]|uniref:Flavin-containing superfamily amine oxidase n=1 Tax=Venturia nashicola TaxID=86259 RepID=A0A4Z1PAI9_9PEZI|nr:flavin-containing superfamily amine oxidase [Venturia nashicola]TLD35041.1 flavin-containing superfamily amine oxidase [Venturia nashicola]